MRKNFERECARCGEPFMALHSGGRAAICPPCRPQHKKERERQSRYGITPQEYDLMLAAQGGRCAACGDGPGETPGDRPLAVDHDHTTDEVRGLLCDRCNVAAGMMLDDPERADKLAGYLRLWR